MSLTTQLRDGRRLARWCADAFPGTPDVAHQVVAAARAAGAPVRPRGEVGPEHWADVGGAFGQRVADLIEHAPPYGALLGMVRAGWLSWQAAHAHAASYPTHLRLTVEQRSRAVSLRRTPDGWLDLGDTRELYEVDPAVQAVLVDFLGRTRRYQATHAPPGQLAGSGAEAGLARSAWVLAACEGIHRSGRIDERLAATLKQGGGPADLRALPSDAVVTELVELAARLRPGGALNALRRAAREPDPGQPLGVVAPVIVPSWADGDVLAGTATETTLIDVKTVISLSNLDRVAQWLWQILLYAWLDTHDLHRIRSVGLYLARHGILLTWSVTELAEQLLADPSTGQRQRTHRHFLGLVADVIRAEGGVFPIA